MFGEVPRHYTKVVSAVANYSVSSESCCNSPSFEDNNQLFDFFLYSSGGKVGEKLQHDLVPNLRKVSRARRT